jgi:hypothetical protein
MCLGNRSHALRIGAYSSKVDCDLFASLLAISPALVISRLFILTFGSRFAIAVRATTAMAQVRNGSDEELLQSHPLMLYASEDWGFDFDLAWGAFRVVRG